MGRPLGHDARYQRSDRRLHREITVTEPTVAAGFARGLLELAVSKGAGRAARWPSARGSTSTALTRTARVPFANYVALMRAAKELTNDPALSLHLGEAANLREDSIVGLIGQSAATMAEAFGQMNRYVRLVVDVDLGSGGDRFRIEAGPDGLWMIDTRTNPNAFPELTESAFAQMVCWVRQIGLTDWARAVHITHSAPAYRGEYDRIFQAPVVFEIATATHCCSIPRPAPTNWPACLDMSSAS